MRTLTLCSLFAIALSLTACRGDYEPDAGAPANAEAPASAPAEEAKTSLPPAEAAAKPPVAEMTSKKAETPAPNPDMKDEKMTEEAKPARELATLGAGCFWCVEAVYLQLDGVISAKSGYMGGHVDNPTYEEVCGKKTGHAEVVQVEFDPNKVSYEQVLDWFWRLHDPTTLNRQGNDVGPQYRSAIFFHSDEQREIAERSKKVVAPTFDDPIVTEVTEAATFWPAEAYHDNYYFQHKNQGYCRAIIMPKLKKLKLDH